jgi:hypothetical protein
MKKNISALIAAIVALSVGINSANASLIGMPINLKVAVELTQVSAPACDFYAESLVAGAWSVNDCLRS